MSSTPFGPVQQINAEVLNTAIPNPIPLTASSSSAIGSPSDTTPS